MKLLLQNVRSGKFCKGPADWTNDKDEALDFLTSDEAIAFARRHRLPEVQVVAEVRYNNSCIHLPYKFEVLPKM